MKIKLFSERQRLLYSELGELQTNVQDEFVFILEEMLAYDDFATGENLECVPEDPISDTVVIKAGAVFFGKKIAWLEADFEQVIDVPSITDRYDIISATASLVDDDNRELTFIGLDDLEYDDFVDTRNIYQITIHYTKDTETVPVGHFPIAKIFVESTGGNYGASEITDLRPVKDDTDLETHRTAAVIDHPDGSILDQHLNADADVALSKLNGLSASTLEMLIRYGFPLDFSMAFTYGLDDEITKIEYTDDEINWEADFTYDVDDFLEAVDFTYPEFNYGIAVTKAGDNISTIAGTIS